MIKKVFLFGISCFSFISFAVAANTETLTIKSGKVSHKFTIEIADNDVSREKGLMFRKELEKDRGMLFVFRSENVQSFWMKNTLIPLDIIFIRSDGTIAKVHSMAKPNDLTLISSEEAVIAALEIKGGEAARRGIKAGNKVIYPVFKKTSEKAVLNPLPKSK